MHLRNSVEGVEEQVLMKHVERKDLSEEQWAQWPKPKHSTELPDYDENDPMHNKALTPRRPALSLDRPSSSE